MGWASGTNEKEKVLIVISEGKRSQGRSSRGWEKSDFNK
jgi:hypothetical protein